jgi:hypothetical protein
MSKSTIAIRLNFINQSNDVNNSDVVIFQKNEASGFGETAVAWLVIQNCGRGDNYPFSFPMDSYVSVFDSYGNYTPQLLANPGDAFQMISSPSGNMLTYKGAADGPTEIDVINNLPLGPINANIYKGGKLLGTKTDIVPGQKAAFLFTPTIYLGLTSDVTEGEVMNSATIATLNTQISLLGISSADILLTGGGSGTGAQPYQFTLQNVKMA